MAYGRPIRMISTFSLYSKSGRVTQLCFSAEYSCLSPSQYRASFAYMQTPLPQAGSKYLNVVNGTEVVQRALYWYESLINDNILYSHCICCIIGTFWTHLSFLNKLKDLRAHNSLGKSQHVQHNPSRWTPWKSLRCTCKFDIASEL